MSPRDLDAWPAIRARVARLVVVAVVMLAACVAALVPLAARAQETCDGRALANNGYVSTAAWWPSQSTDVCAALATVQWPGAMLEGSCVSAGVDRWTATYAPTNTAYTWQPYPQGCVWSAVPPDPSASSASAPAGAASAATGADVARVELLLAAGIGVLCWGMGYAGGFNR